MIGPKTAFIALFRLCNFSVATGSDEDLEYYVRQCGDIMGVLSRLPSDKRTAKHILEHVLTQVAEFKKSTQT
jgi:hypothetical protein